MTKRPRVYELKIRGVASDLVRAEFDDVELWEAPGATWLRTGEADTAALYGLIKRIETLGLVLLKVDEVRPANQTTRPRRSCRPGSWTVRSRVRQVGRVLAWPRSRTRTSRSAIGCR